MTQRTNMATTLFEVGFQAGLDADEAPDAFDMSRYKQHYVLGFVVGRSIVESGQRASRMAGAAMAGELGARYSLPLDLLLVELEFSLEQKEKVRSSYEKITEGAKNG
ncbi:DUF2623 family protein [Cupriavidus taiwanensis]|uniref:DUF2623 family protein n=1 Tax=Cupriavidus taiwanensis TaxID=164546 RepID=UPI000E104CB9|nr:DUF2623 family protein [Cupriavidus taiwanensis]SPA56708.1 conserved protein of unknown function [Cupriavidus taiwanensis]